MIDDMHDVELLREERARRNHDDVMHLRDGVRAAARFTGEGWSAMVTGEVTAGDRGSSLYLGTFMLRDWAGNPSSLLHEVIAPKAPDPLPSPAGQVRRHPSRSLAGIRMDAPPSVDRPWVCTDGRDRSERDVQSWPILHNPTGAADDGDRVNQRRGQ